MIRGLFAHLLLSLRLQSRQPQALVFGFAVPLLFLVGFASVFGRNGAELTASLGKVLTITILGSACFGLPIGLVAERERGVWRRYRITPAGAGRILVSTVLARLVLLLLAGLLVVSVAIGAYDMPWPSRPGELLIAYLAACVAFLGIGLAIATLADTVPAVQALGQCLFLPMLMVGGIAIPLRMLPSWAQTISPFMPGRHAVDAANAALASNTSLASAWPSLIGLVLIGVAGAAAALATPRWDEQRLTRAAQVRTIAVTLAGWLLAGLLLLGAR